MPHLNSVGTKLYGAAAETLFSFIKKNGHKEWEGELVPADVAVNDGMVCWFRTTGTVREYECSFLVGKDKKLHPIVVDHALAGCE